MNQIIFVLIVRFDCERCSFKSVLYRLINEVIVLIFKKGNQFTNYRDDCLLEINKRKDSFLNGYLKVIFYFEVC